MNHHKRLATWMGAVLGTVCALLLVSAHAAENRQFTEEFHHTYPLAASGTVKLNNLNGAVHITAWDRNEVKVDALKYAGTKQRLDEAQIRVDAGADYVSIRTEYPDRDLTFDDGDQDNPASVEYTVTVPRSARLDKIELVNGPLDIAGSSGEVRASCVNGSLTARDLSGETNLSAVNGRLEAHFAKLPDSRVELRAVNGRLALFLPVNANATLEASNVNGGIDNDFGLQANRHEYVGIDLKGNIGSGGTRIELSNVNGQIAIRQASAGE
jgi:hypothetical protein